ncbi:MAG: GNAT family N-acetyltransferase [Saprospiraceae bacterium]|nr:GNAT family N-acetyltransferase [Saprospiraceae bacterium]
MLLPRFFGQGLATEIASALTDYLFQEMGTGKVVAVTDPEHQDSQRVLEKCGFQQAGFIQVYWS